VTAINTVLWNDRADFYQDCDRHGQFSDVKSIGAYWALLDDEVIPPNRMAPFVQHLRENTAFRRPHSVPSQSADSAGYDAETGDHWRGGVWSTTNFMVLKGLRATGNNALAHEIAVNHLQNVWEVFQHTDTLWQYYAPERTAAGDQATPDSVGGTGLTPIAILLEDVIGLSTDWPQRQVVWDRRLPETGLWGVRNYPLGPDGCLNMLGDAKRIVVDTEVPFTLTIYDPKESLTAAVPAGGTEIDLSD
jgi:hypothetical protein